MKTWLLRFFTFSATEQRGIWIFSLLTLCSVILRLFWPQPEIVFQAPDAISRDSILEWMKAHPSPNAASVQENSKTKARVIAPEKPFDPNTCNAEAWMAMGFSEKETSGILRFREKGGLFRKPEDLKKLYCMTEQRYEVLLPWIALDHQNPTEHKPRGSKPFTQNVVVELNQADSLQLVRIKGIGPYRASGILRFRNKLGGFWCLEQLLEIRSINDSLLKAIHGYIEVDSNRVRRIPINTASLESMEKHPYFWKGVAKRIVNFRDKHGAFRGPSDLARMYGLSDEQRSRLIHYVAFE